MISTSPVARLGLIMPSGRGATCPRTLTQYSLRRSPALACRSTSRSGLKTACTMPLRSRRSIKITPPWSRQVAIQPLTTTSRPTCSARRSPQ